MLRRSVLDIDGVATPVVSAGEERDEQAVVCRHGNPGYSADWLDLAPRVAPFSRLVAPDMPGFGDAGRPADFDYSVPGYTRHLDALLRRLDVRRAHLVCHDFGVGWRLSWALANPNAVASLTLVNIGVLPGYRWHVLARVWRTRGLGELAMASVSHFGFALSMKLANPRPLPREFVDGMYRCFDAGLKRAVLKLYRATDDGGAMFAPQPEAFRHLTAPVCVVWGARDPYVDVRYAERQREFLASAQGHIFEDSGHWPHADNPERFADVVVSFLQRARQV